MAANEGPLEDYQWNGRSFEKAPLPLFAVPTTAGTGSEVTGVAVITSRNTKKGVADRYIFPEVALVDPELMRSLPPYVTAITGMDALTHAIEAYIGLGANEITDSLSERAIELIGTYLPKAYANGNDMEARYYMAVASTMAGIAMDQAGLGIVHAMASPVCAYLHYSHGFANAFLLPYGMEFNVIARKDKLACVSKLLGESTEFMTVDKAAWSSIERVRLLLDELDLSDKISAEISTSSDVDVDIFAKATANMFLARNNPRIVTVDQCKKIFEEIFFGD
jgi:alcohol dehydrogenase